MQSHRIDSGSEAAVCTVIQLQGATGSMGIKRRIESSARTIGEVLRRPVAYKVPVNQRDYSWTSEEIETLWQDLTSALEDGRGEYFLGAIVLAPSEKDEDALEIVDGQQRLATLTMILSAIRLAWLERDDAERAAEIHALYLGSRDRRTKATTPKLSLNETNDPVFQAAVVDGQPEVAKRTTPKSNQLLIAGIGCIKRLLKAHIEAHDDAEETLVELEEYIVKSVNVISIEVGDDSDAFIIFETLNDRGLELAVSDLVKNYLFSLAEERLSSFKKAWSEVALLIGSENLTPFLRHLWLSEYQFVRERDLYRSLREKVKTKTAARHFVEKLRKSADHYAALLNPESPYWADVPDEARASLRSLRIFRATQFRPLALAVMDGEDAQDVAKMLRIVVVLTFRYTVVSGYNANELERIYSNAGMAVRSSRKHNPKAIFDLVKEAYVDDDRFAENFTRFTVAKSDVARYVLSELNRGIETDAAIGVEEDKVSLEHILPKNPGPEWVGAVPKGEESPGWTERIGNLTLLEKGVNRGLGNKDFKTKKAKGFGKSKLALNESISRRTQWTSQEIEERSEELAAVAKKRWRLTF